VTDLLVRPTSPADADLLTPGHPVPARPLLMTGALAAICSAAAGLLVVEVVVTLLGLGDGRSSASLSDVLRVGAAVWLLASGSVLHLPGGTVTLIPLGLTAFAVLLLHRAGRAVARHTRRGRSSGRRQIPGVAGAVAVPYAVVVALVAVITSGPDVRPDVLRAALGALLLALAAAGIGAAGVLAPDRLAFLRRGGRVLRLSGPAPTPYRVALRGALAGGAVLIAGAAVLAGVSIALHMPTAADLGRDTDGGMLGHTGVLAVQLALLPNLVVWFLAYAAGPGFSIGADTAVRLTGGRLGEVPALPMFAGLPGRVALPVVIATCLIPAAAGVLAGRVVAARLTGARGRVLLLSALAVGPLTGLLVLVAVACASGQVLGGGLADVGASAWRTGVAVTLEVGLVAALSAVVPRLIRRRKGRPAG
jgi:hypothetical protein